MYSCKEYLEYIIPTDKKKEQKQIDKLTKELQRELDRLNGIKPLLPKKAYKEIEKASEIKELQDKIKTSKKVLKQLAKDEEYLSLCKKMDKNKESSLEKSSTIASKPLSEQEFNQWLTAQLEEIRKPICLVLHTANGLVRFSAEKYEIKPKSYFTTTWTYEEFLKLKGVL